MFNINRKNNSLINTIRLLFIRALSLILATLMMAGPSIELIAATETSAVKKANYVIKDMSSAQSALSSLANSQQIQALVYLKESYTLREEADAYSKSVATVATGQTISIIGVDEDGGRNIWYKVRCYAFNTNYTGYIEREFVACADSRLLNWEDKYITTTGREEVSSVTDTADIEAFPESYRDGLYALKKKHPEWTFVKFNTGLEWNSSVKTEGSGNRSWIATSGTPSSYREEVCAQGWSYASDDIIAYYMDPRNFLDETQIFQFELLSYNAATQPASAVSKIVEGTFMKGNIEGTDTSYVSTFMSLGEKYKISPILQAARIYAEQGKNGSTMISGTYSGYEGLYNYYNIKASGRTDAECLANGLTYARNHGWTTRMAALEGGANFISGNYVSVGQDTYYFQKWNVSAPSKGIYEHQYMQDITQAYKNASSSYKGYSKVGLLSGTAFVFKIPVYDKMPDERQIKPDAADTMTINMDKVENLPVDQNAVIVPYINGAEIEGYGYTYASSNSGVVTVNENGVLTGVKPGSANITVRSAAGSATCSVNVIKADIAVADLDIPSFDITYSPDGSLSKLELPDKFSWTDGTTVPAVDNSGYSVTYAPDDSKYNSISLTIEVKVKKATVDKSDISIPSDIKAEVGTELSHIALPKNFMWADATGTVSSRAGKYEYSATYCPDVNNYNVTENISIPVEVTCTKHNWGEWSEPSNGKIRRSCNTCDETQELDEKDKIDEKDCVKDGHEYVDGVCTRCGFEEPVIQTHVHEYSESENTATCTKDGEIIYTCSCGDSYSKPSKATGHKMNGTKCETCGYELKPTAAVTPVPSTVPKVNVTPTPAGTPVPGTTPAAGQQSGGTGTTPAAGKPYGSTGTTPAAGQQSGSTGTTPAAGQSTNSVTPASSSDSGSTTPAPSSSDEKTSGSQSASAATTNQSSSGQSASQTSGDSTNTTQAAADNKEEGKTENKTENKTEIKLPTLSMLAATVAEKLDLPITSNGSTQNETNNNDNSNKVTTNNDNGAAANQDNGVRPNSNNGATSNPNNSVTPGQDNELIPDSDTETAQGPVNGISQSETPATADNTENNKTSQTVTVIELVDTTTLDSDSLRGLVGDTNAIQVVVGDDITWDIDLAGVDISQVNVDMKVTVGEADIPETVLQSLKTDDLVFMTLAHNGAFGFDAVLNVEVGTDHEGKYANLYYYNPETDKLELIDSVPVTEDGKAAFNMKHASEYVISFTDKQQLAKTGANMMLIGLLCIILAGGIGVIIFVIVRTARAGSDTEKYFDDEDNSLD